MKLSSRLSMALILLIVALYAPPAVRAVTVPVTTLVDEADGSCADGDCSLRDALATALPGDTVTIELAGILTLTQGELVIAKDLLIDGPGWRALTVSAGGQSRVFTVNPGVTAQIWDLTLADGAESKGGCVYNSGTLTLERCFVTRCDAEKDGGGLLNAGVAQVSRSTFRENDALNGGGMRNEDGTAVVVNSTFYDNSASERGGGLDNASDALVTVINSTFYGNSGAGLGTANGLATVYNTILAANTEDNCKGVLDLDSADNLSSDDTCVPGFTICPISELKLSWSVWVFKLLEGSVAVDLGDNIVCPALDQVGAHRPLDGDLDGLAVCDAGAYELTHFARWVYLPVVTMSYAP